MDCTMMRYMKDYTLLVKQCSSAFFYKSICFIACKTRLDSNVKYTKYLQNQESQHNFV